MRVFFYFLSLSLSKLKKPLLTKNTVKYVFFYTYEILVFLLLAYFEQGFYLLQKFLRETWGFDPFFVSLRPVHSISAALLMALPFLLIQKRSLWRVWLAYGPLLLFWGVVQGYQSVLSIIPGLQDILHITNLYDVLPLWPSVLLTFVVVILLLAPFVRFNTALLGQKASLFKVILLVLAVSVVHHKTPWLFQEKGLIRKNWAIQEKGRGGFFSSVLLHSALRQNEAQHVFSLGRDHLLSDLSFYVSPKEIQSHLGKRNIYIISMESWTNPDWMPGMRKLYPSVSSFAYPPFYKEYGKKLSTMRVRTFGGYSDQTHFEVLCGLPSLELAGWLDQPSLSTFGHSLYCLPRKLKGYVTLADSSYDLFKENTVYGLMGFTAHNFFDENHFEGTVDGRPFQIQVQKTRFGRFPEDKEFSALNKFLQPLIGKEPFFLFADTDTGHGPLKRDEEPQRKPDRFPKRGTLSDEEVRLLNSYYYRTKDIYTYVKTLQKRDPSAIIFFFADHLLTDISYKKYGYLKKMFPLSGMHHEKDGYLKKIAPSILVRGLGKSTTRRWIVPALFITNGQVKTFKGIFAEEFHKLILNEATNGWFCTRVMCSVGDTSKKAHERRVLDYSIFYTATRRGDFDKEMKSSS